jgi:hypothetical protein
MPTRKPRRYTIVAELPQGPFYLNPNGPGFFSIVVPIARTNEVTNPSLETNTTGYTAVGGSIARSTAQSYHGAYSLAVTPTAALTDGAYYGTISMTAGQVRAISCKWLGAAGVKYKLSVATTGGVDLVARRFVATGRWQWVWLYWVETSTTTRRIYFTKDSNTSTAPFYIDGVQSEVINAGETVSTYIDGDQAGLLPNQFPYPYRWNGTPHASTSTRDVTTRAGGYVMNLDRFRFKLMGYAGLGITLVANIASAGGATDGSTFQATIASSRNVAIRGRFEASTPEQLDRQRSDLYSVIGPDSATPRQSVALQYQRFKGDMEVGDFGRIVASYQSGLEQNTNGMPAEEATITFTQYLPAIFTNESGVSLGVRASLANANAVLRRTADGVWHTLSTGLNGPAYAIAEHPNGTIYVVGDFTDAGGSGADFAAIYNPLTDTFSVVKSATSIGAIVRDVAISPNGIVYFVGDFINADGNANADRIVAYDPVANTFAALGTGGNGILTAVAVGIDGQVYAGALNAATDLGGVANTNGAGRWDGAAWNAMTTGLDNGAVLDILVDGADIYYVGTFTGMSAVANTNRQARWDGSAWNSLVSGTTNGDIYSVVKGPNGLLYMGGAFTTIGGVAANRHAAYNKTSFSVLGTGVDNIVHTQAFDASGMLYLGGEFTAANGIALPDAFARWNGSTYLNTDVDVPGIGTVITSIAPARDGSVYVGFFATGTAGVSSVTSVVTTGTARTYPTVTFYGPAAGFTTIYQITNATIGRVIFFNLVINPSEIVTLRTSSNGATLTSSFRGDVSNAILQGSSPDFALAPGTNSVTVFSQTTIGSGVAALMTWANAVQSASDLTN